MQVFVYEFVTGGGWYSCAPSPPDGSLLAEGRAMLRAVASDFAELPDVKVHLLHDCRLPDLSLPGCQIHPVSNQRDERAAFTNRAELCDWTLVIAPEFSGFLTERCRCAAEVGRLLGPGVELVTLASDKQLTAEHLSKAGVPVPFGVSIEKGDTLPHNFPYPAVLKPRDGAGSQGVQLITNAQHGVKPISAPCRLERFCPGTAASVCFLCGPHQQIALQPCRQHLSDDGLFTYLGGSLVCESAVANRAIQLASRAVAALPNPFGYLGFDVVLGNDPTGAEDFVIEVNPRLTTSYVGLRAACRFNLAEAMLAIANDAQMALSWNYDLLTFQADGRVMRHT